MDHGIREIDHLLTAVTHPMEAGADFERLGFTVTPISRIESLGIANRLVCFTPLSEGNAAFIELMGLEAPERAPAALREMLSGAQGIRSMVMVSDDAHAAHAALTADGYAPVPVAHFERYWELPDGERLRVEFDVIPAAVSAPFPFNVCRYFTLEHYVREDFRVHRNGIGFLTGVYCASADPLGDAAFYERLFGTQARALGDEGFSVARANVEMLILDIVAMRRRFPQWSGGAGFVGYRLKSVSLARSIDWFGRNGVAITPASLAGGFCLPVQLTRGNLVHIV